VSFVVYVNDEPVELGPSFDVLKRFGELGRIDPTAKFSALQGLVDGNGENLDPAYVKQVALEAGQFQAKFSPQLTPELRQFLGTLSVLTPPTANGNGKHLRVVGNGGPEWKRVYVHPYSRNGHPVSGYWREDGRGNVGPTIPRDEFVKLLDALPAGTRFKLDAQPGDEHYNLRGTWEKVDHAGLPYWYNRERALTRASGDFHAHAGRHVLDALETHRKPQEREYVRSKSNADFMATPESLVERGIVPSSIGLGVGALLSREIKRAQEAIDRVHRVHLDAEPPPKIALISSPGVGDGSYSFDDSGGVAVPNYIRIGPMLMFPEIAYTHEWGHYLDQQILGRRENFGSRQAIGLDGYSGDKYEHALRPIMDTIAVSEKTKHLMNMLRSDATVNVRENGVSRTISLSDPDVHRYTTYLLQPEEMFARAYSQWIALRSDPEGPMMEAVRERSESAGVLHPQQWDDEDFQPIAEAFDQVFGKLDWLTDKAKKAVAVRPYTRQGRPVAGYTRHGRPGHSPGGKVEWLRGDDNPFTNPRVSVVDEHGERVAKAAVEAWHGLKYGELAVRVSRVSQTNFLDRAISVNGEIYRGDNVVGGFQRSFNPRGQHDTKPFVNHDEFRLDSSAHAAGMAAAFNQVAERMYREQGIHQVSIYAAVVGAYAWARQGFDFAGPDSLEKVAQEAKSRAEQALAARYITQEQHDEFVSRLPSREDLREARVAIANGGPWQDDVPPGKFAHTWEIANFGRDQPYAETTPTTGGMWLGKHAMLSNPWDGVKQLPSLAKKSIDAADLARAYDAWAADKIANGGPTMEGLGSDGHLYFDDDLRKSA
jgi:hypothetical protein